MKCISHPAKCRHVSIGITTCISVRQAFLRPIGKGCVDHIDCNYGLNCKNGICSYCEDCVKSKGVDRDDPDWDNKCSYGEWDCPSDCNFYFNPCEDNPLACCKGLTCKTTPEHTSMKRCQLCTLSGESCDNDSECCANIHTDDVCVRGACISMLGKGCSNDAYCRSNPHKIGKTLKCKKGMCDY